MKKDNNFVFQMVLQVVEMWNHVFIFYRKIVFLELVNFALGKPYVCLCRKASIAVVINAIYFYLLLQPQ